MRLSQKKTSITNPLWKKLSTVGKDIIQQKVFVQFCSEKLWKKGFTQKSFQPILTPGFGCFC